MQENNSEMLSFVDEQMDKIKSKNNIYGIGKVIEIKDFIIKVIGLEEAMFYEKITIGSKAIGYVLRIEKNFVYVAILKKEKEIVVGDLAYQTNEVLKGEYSKNSIGRIIDMFGYDRLKNKKFQDIKKIDIENNNIPLMDRTDVVRPLNTGIIGIDLLYPIGKGQRQLIIGDKKTGKTELCISAIKNQLGKNVICIYVAIGKTKKETKEIYYEFLKNGTMNYTIMIAAFNDDLPTTLSLTPYFALAVAQDYMKKGYDVLVVIDDLKRHAEAYREISLISGKSPGRDAYPSDIFYIHARLLEKGCQYKNGASITILPVVETKSNDITDYISTNIISITDGQIVLSSKNFQKGLKPAIDYGLSVSRLGGRVQTEEMKNLGTKVRRKLLSYLETKDVYELANIDEMSVELQNKMKEGKKILESLNQPKGKLYTEEEMKERFSFLEENHDEY